MSSQASRPPDERTEFWLKSGRAQASLGKGDEAAADFTKAIELDPGTHAALNERGIAFYRKGQWDKAIDDFSAAIKRLPTNPRAPESFARLIGNVTWNRGAPVLNVSDAGKLAQPSMTFT